MAEVSIHDPEGTTPSEEKEEKDIWPMTREETRAFTLDWHPGAAEGVLKVTAVGYDGPEVEVPIHQGFFSNSSCLERVLHQTFFQQDGNCRYLCLPEATYMPYIPFLLRFLNVPNSFDLDMATYRRPMEDCLDLTLCADFLQIPEPWWTMFYEHMTAKFSGRAPNLAEPKVSSLSYADSWSSSKLGRIFV